MIKVLEENKKIKVETGRIIVSATITYNCFENLKDKNGHSICFFGNDEEEYRNGITFTGIATLRNGDTSNELEATRIAETKMERSYYKYIRRYQKNMIKGASERLAFFKKALANSEDNIKKANSHIEAICERL